MFHNNRKKRITRFNSAVNQLRKVIFGIMHAQRNIRPTPWQVLFSHSRSHQTVKNSTHQARRKAGCVTRRGSRRQRGEKHPSRPPPTGEIFIIPPPVLFFCPSSAVSCFWVFFLLVCFLFLLMLSGRFLRLSPHPLSRLLTSPPKQLMLAKFFHFYFSSPFIYSRKVQDRFFAPLVLAGAKDIYAFLS